MRLTPKENEIQRAITDLLTAKGLLCFRMNSGAMKGQHNGKSWFLRFGEKGMADLLTWFPRRGFDEIEVPNPPYTVWLEVKTATGYQSAAQKDFETSVAANGHWYFVVRSSEQMEEILETFEVV